MTSLFLRLITLVLVAVLGTASTGAAAPPASHNDLQAQISAVQNSINTLQSTLNALQSQVGQQPLPAWSQALPAAQRFELVLGGAAVLDHETELVWEQSPSAIVRDWSSANLFCNRTPVGNRLGWRLPTVQELASLVDPTNPNGNPDLPPGHPFTNVQSSAYWSATALDPDHVWFVGFNVGGVGSAPKSLTLLYWCVRGGHGGTDVQ